MPNGIKNYTITGVQMRVHCPTCEFDICDFCMHYNFNGEWYADGDDGFHGPVYVEEGYCRLTGCYSDPSDICEVFHCFKARNAIKGNY